MVVNILNTNSSPLKPEQFSIKRNKQHIADQWNQHIRRSTISESDLYYILL